MVLANPHPPSLTPQEIVKKRSNLNLVRSKKTEGENLLTYIFANDDNGENSKLGSWGKGLSKAPCTTFSQKVFTTAVYR